MFETNKKDEQIKQAAYALNLCTVSVSQIIDYSDLNILEQEYEAILNNLNLENFPKDDELRSVLEKILDTITFFRIQKIKKQQLEKKYQHKMKNAIWSAVPNIGLIVAGGHPVTMAISLASQIGCGYMNYRKEKSNLEIEREDEEIQMQISAIEQFNALRRELFTTAWKLAETYKFPDEFRLSEKQIDLYNRILMDSDPVRKYQRLKDIEKYFSAYPPFYYYLGNTANVIAHENLCRIKEIEKYIKNLNEHYADNETNLMKLEKEKVSCKKIFEYYQKIALEQFNKFFYENGDSENENELEFTERNRYSLLREDLIAASCALEYTELLDEQNENDRKNIERLLKIAEKYAPNEFDILQLCAMEYIRIGKNREAKMILQKLVNEDYNKIVNVQILTRILSEEIKLEDKIAAKKARENYYLIETRVNPVFLFPFPNSVESEVADFLDTQKAILIKKAIYAFSEFRIRYMKKFNQLIPVPYPEKYYPDEYFYDSNESIDKRISSTIKFLKTDNKNAHNYLDSLKNFSFGVRIIELFDEISKNLAQLAKSNSSNDDETVSFFSNEEIEEFCNEIKINLSKNEKIKECEDYFSELNVEEILVTDKELEKSKDKKDSFDFEKINSLFNITFSSLTDSAFAKLVKYISDFYEKDKNDLIFDNPMKELSEIDEQFNSWAEKQNISVSNEEFYLNDMPKETENEKKYFTYEDLGGDYKEKFQISEKIKMLSKENVKEKIIKNTKKYNLWLKYYESENEQSLKFSKILQKKLNIQNKINYKNRQKIFAILEDLHPVIGTDLLFATNGIYLKNVFGIQFVPYKNNRKGCRITWEDEDKTKIKIGSTPFSNTKDLNMAELINFIKEISKKETGEDDSFSLYLEEPKTMKILNYANQTKEKVLDSAKFFMSSF